MRIGEQGRLGKLFALRKKKGSSKSGEEKDAEWYDETFDRAKHWKVHYSQSRYYFLWTVIADRIVRAQRGTILEVGCGPGQLAALLYDKGVRKYHGFDFSAKRIAQAKQICPEFYFSVEDAFKTELFTTCDYQVVVCTEFLEHVEKDLEVLGRLRSGTLFYGTVPNFPYTSHVRHFRNAKEVSERYRGVFTDLQVSTFLANDHGRKFFLMEGSVS